MSADTGGLFMHETETHDCAIDGHVWEYFDDSFDHEFGTEIDVYRMCEICGIHEQGPFSDECGFDDVPEYCE